MQQEIIPMKKIKVGGIAPLDIIIQFKHVVTKAVGCWCRSRQKGFYIRIGSPETKQGICGLLMNDRSGIADQWEGDGVSNK